MVRPEIRLIEIVLIVLLETKNIADELGCDRTITGHRVSVPEQEDMMYPVSPVITEIFIFQYINLSYWVK